MIIEIFQESNKDVLEKALNEWLGKEKRHIYHVAQSQSGHTVTISIWYDHYPLTSSDVWYRSLCFRPEDLLAPWPNEPDEDEQMAPRYNIQPKHFEPMDIAKEVLFKDIQDITNGADTPHLDDVLKRYTKSTVIEALQAVYQHSRGGARMNAVVGRIRANGFRGIKRFTSLHEEILLEIYG